MWPGPGGPREQEVEVGEAEVESENSGSPSQDACTGVPSPPTQPTQPLADLARPPSCSSGLCPGPLFAATRVFSLHKGRPSPCAPLRQAEQPRGTGRARLLPPRTLAGCREEGATGCGWHRGPRAPSLSGGHRLVSFQPLTGGHVAQPWAPSTSSHRMPRLDSC